MIRAWFFLPFSIAALLSACGPSNRPASDDATDSTSQQASTIDSDADTLAAARKIDDLPDVKPFLTRFPHLRPTTLVTRHKAYTLDGETKPYYQYGEIDPEYVAAFLQSDTARKHYHVVRFLPEEDAYGVDTLVRIVYVDSMDFYLATLHTNGQLIDKTRLTYRRGTTERTTKSQEAHFLPSQRRFDLVRREYTGVGVTRTSVAGQILLDGDIVENPMPITPDFQAFKNAFPQKTVPLTMTMENKDILDVTQALSQRLHPGFVLAHLDTAYAPKATAQGTVYPVVYAPVARISLPAGRTGLIVRETNFVEAGEHATLKLSVYEPGGAWVMSRDIGGISHSSSGYTETTVYTSFEITSDLKIIVTKRAQYLNTNSGVTTEDVTVTTYQVQPNGTIVYQS